MSTITQAPALLSESECQADVVASTYIRWMANGHREREATHATVGVAHLGLDRSHRGTSKVLEFHDKTGQDAVEMSLAQ